MRLVLFDFDGTLTRGDSLLPFLHHRLGTWRWVLGLLWMSPVLAAYALKLLRNDRAKEMLLRHLLGGQAVEALRRAGAGFAAEVLPELLRADTMKTLAAHRARGDACVLVSASLDLYLEPWAASQGFAACLCSSLETDGHGLVTGRLRGGNCFGEVKVQRVVAWLAGRKPERVTAYGDSAGDAAMLAFADEGHWVASAN